MNIGCCHLVVGNEVVLLLKRHSAVCTIGEEPSIKEGKQSPLFTADFGDTLGKDNILQPGHEYYLFIGGKWSSQYAIVLEWC